MQSIGKNSQMETEHNWTKSQGKDKVMKATVSTGKGLNFRCTVVEINNVSEMTPTAAISFRNVAYGVAASATVSGGSKVYRVTGIGDKSKARRIATE